MHVHAAAIRRILWSVVLSGWLAFAVVAAGFHPAWDAAATASAIPLVAGTCAGVLLSSRRPPAPRPAHARPRVTLRHALWAGIPIAMLMIAVAQSDPVRLRVLDYCGTVIMLTCPAALTLRWWFARRAGQPVDHKLYELTQNMAWTRQDVSRVHLFLTDLAEIAGVEFPDGPGGPVGGIRRRHLRPMRTGISDDTGPQQAVLGAPLVLVGDLK